MRQYTFNDFLFNMMSWLTATVIEAFFNVGNPKKNDIILYGEQKFIITAVEYKHGMHTLTVRKL